MSQPEHDLTPAQEREARRQLRRVLGEGTPEEQSARLLEQAFRKEVTRKRRRIARALVEGVAAMFDEILRYRPRR